MKNKLLVTSALMLLISAHAEDPKSGLESLIVEAGKEETLKDKGTTGLPSSYYYDSIEVQKGGTLTIKNSDIKTWEKDINIFGKLSVEGTGDDDYYTVLEAGNDNDGLNKSANMILDGATVTLKTLI